MFAYDSNLNGRMSPTAMKADKNIKLSIAICSDLVVDHVVAFRGKLHLP